MKCVRACVPGRASMQAHARTPTAEKRGQAICCSAWQTGCSGPLTLISCQAMSGKRQSSTSEQLCVRDKIARWFESPLRVADTAWSAAAAHGNIGGLVPFKGIRFGRGLNAAVGHYGTDVNPNPNPNPNPSQILSSQFLKLPCSHPRSSFLLALFF